MYLLFFVLPVILMIPLIIYFYFYFRRIVLYICKEMKYKWLNVLLFIFSLLFVLPAFNLFGFWAVVVLHLFVISLIIDIIHYILKEKNKYFDII